LGCNTTVEFEDHFLEEAGQKIGLRHNFEVIDAQFKILGLCPKCRKSQKGAELGPELQRYTKLKTK
jgi:Fe2+ or Zn2+ uptake regulation protein